MRMPMPNDPVSLSSINQYIYNHIVKHDTAILQPLTDQERLALHARIISYQHLDGALYLGACDLLYFEELAKLQYAQKQLDGWKEIQDMAQNFKKELILLLAKDQA